MNGVPIEGLQDDTRCKILVNEASFSFLCRVAFCSELQYMPCQVHSSLFPRRTNLFLRYLGRVVSTGSEVTMECTPYTILMDSLTRTT